MKTIGGFFELELPNDLRESYHPMAAALSTGRACLSMVIQVEKPSLVYVPYYTCDSLLAPLIELGIDYVFYSINEHLEIDNLPVLNDRELIIYINYFGIKTIYTKFLRQHFGKNLIIDNTHSFFNQENSSEFWSYNSARKFFGVPDGAYLYGPSHNVTNLAVNNNINIDHLINRLLGKQSEAYENFIAYEANIDTKIRKISVVSEALLSKIDYKYCAQKRIQNFIHYHQTFGEINELSIDCNDAKYIPTFCYPLLLKSPINRTALFKKNIFIPWLWRDTITRHVNGYNWEKTLTDYLLPLPIDHRYGEEEINIVINSLLNILR